MNTGRQRETQLEVADLGRLNRLLQNVSAYWIPIADQLEMTSQVDIIWNTPDNTNPSQFLRDLLHKWLNREHPLPTLETLCQALRGDVAIIGGGNVAKKLEKEFQAQKDAADPIVEVDKVLEINGEDIKVLNILEKFGKLERISHHVSSCEVKQKCVKLVGTPEGCEQAEKEIESVLKCSVVESLPECVSSAVGKYATRCMAENEGVLVLPDENKILFTAEDRECCRKAIEWMKANAYPFALQFEERGRFFLTTSSLPGSTAVVVKAAPEAIRAKYPGRFMMELKQGGLSWDSDTLREKLESIFEKLEPYQSKLKVGYEARFGHVLWKHNDKASIRRGGPWILDHFRNPHLHPVFHPRVHPNIQKVLSKCRPVTSSDGCLISPVKLLDPLKLTVTRHDGKEEKCVAVIEEWKGTSGSRFLLNNVFYDHGGTAQFDIVLPERKYDVRVAPNFAPAVEQYTDDKEYEEVHKIVDKFRSSIHRSPKDNTLWMKVRGPNYQVRFLRQKEQTQYKWKANEKWIVAVYNVQQFEIPDKEFEMWSMDKQEKIPLKETKTEIELWNQKWFGDFAHRAHFTKGQYAPVRSTADMQLPDEDTSRKGSHWTTREMMNDFEEFLDAAVSITDLLTQDV